VRGMQRYIERDDVILLAVALEFDRVVTLIAVEDQQPVFALCPGRRMVVEVLNPIQAYCIGSLDILGGRDTPVGLGGCIRCTSWRGGTARPS
jgi:hypothetical protein